MIIIIIIIVGVIMYYFFSLQKKEDIKNQQKTDISHKESLENYTIKKNLFLLFKDYLYSNIDEFKKIDDLEIIQKKIENDFPNYGKGIRGDGIMNDLDRYDLLYRDFLTEKIILGDPFQIISISYPNFNIFCRELYNSGFKMRYTVGGYYSDFGDDITKITFKVERDESNFFLGLSNGDNSNMRDFEKRHNVKTVKDEMYLFCELQTNKNPPFSYPYFDIIKLRKDITVKEYHSYFKKHINESKVI
jgi:hypothetical protein